MFLVTRLDGIYTSAFLNLTQKPYILMDEYFRKKISCSRGDSNVFTNVHGIRYDERVRNGSSPPKSGLLLRKCVNDVGKTLSGISAYRAAESCAFKMCACKCSRLQMAIERVRSKTTRADAPCERRNINEKKIGLIIIYIYISSRSPSRDFRQVWNVLAATLPRQRHAADTISKKKNSFPCRVPFSTDRERGTFKIRRRVFAAQASVTKIENPVPPTDSPCDAAGPTEINSPPSLRQVMLGSGNPDAAHRIETLPPSRTTMSVLVG